MLGLQSLQREEPVHQRVHLTEGLLHLLYNYLLRIYIFLRVQIEEAIQKNASLTTAPGGLLLLVFAKPVVYDHC